MERRTVKSISGVVIFLLLATASPFAQTISINAGPNQIINWEKAHSARLAGVVSPNTIKTAWTCPQNAEVVFKDADNPVTEATFPRPSIL
jgi:hypothetical protein